MAEHCIPSLMRHFFLCTIAVHNHGKLSFSIQRQRRHHSEPLSSCEFDLESIVALQRPRGPSSTSLSLHTHYMQTLDNTWVLRNVQLVDFHLSRQFCHSHEVYVGATELLEVDQKWWALRSSSLWSARHWSPPKCLPEGRSITWFSFCLIEGKNVISNQVKL